MKERIPGSDEGRMRVDIAVHFINKANISCMGSLILLLPFLHRPILKKIVDKLITEWVTGVGVIFHSAGVVCYIYQPPPHTSGCKHTCHTTSIYIFRHIIYTAYKHNFNIYNKGSAVCKLWADHKQLTLSLLDSREAQHFDMEEIYSFIMLWFIYFTKEETEKFRISISVYLDKFYSRYLTMANEHYRDGFLRQRAILFTWQLHSPFLISESLTVQSGHFW